MAKSEQIKVGAQSSPEDRQRQEAQWRGLLGEQSRSGLTQTEFCRRLSIPNHRFFWWKREIAIRDGREPPRGKTEKRRGEARTSIVPVRVTTPEVLPTQLGEKSSFEIVLPRGRVLRVPPQFDEEGLARLLRILEG